LLTIIDRARKNNFYFSKPERKAHEYEVLTNYPGELIQHDSSHYQFAPYAKMKWYLITSLDDFSRFILYAILVTKETTWEHILALEYVLLKYGFPLAYYVEAILSSGLYKEETVSGETITDLLTRLTRSGNRS
jgi:hypothetical protein